MIISELIVHLEMRKKLHGDVEVTTVNILQNPARNTPLVAVESVVFNSGTTFIRSGGRESITAFSVVLVPAR